MKAFDFAEFLLDVVTIKSTAPASGDNGGVVLAPADRHADVPCNIQYRGGAKPVVIGNVQVACDYVAYFDRVLALSPGDVLVDAAGQVYEILSWGRQGGANPLGTVFVIALKKQDPQDALPEG